MTENLLSKDGMDEVKADCEYMKDNWIKLKTMCLEEENRFVTAVIIGFAITWRYRDRPFKSCVRCEGRGRGEYPENSSPV